MTILNTTFFCMDPGIAKKMTDWIYDTYRAAAISCGAMPEISLLMKVTVPEEMDTEGDSYALHLAFGSREQAETWNDGEGHMLRGTLAMLFPQQVLSFTSYLEVIR